VGYLSPPPAPGPVIVYKDVGGLVSDYEAQTERYRAENREVRLHECRSACTMALSLPNVCVYPDAKVKFHQAYNAITRETDLGVSARLFASYPAAVQGRLGQLTRDYHVLSGTELIALGVRNCIEHRDAPTIMVAQRKQAPAAPLAGSNPLGDMAQSVRVAVANAFSQPDSSETIRVAIPDRKPIPPTLARLPGDSASEAAIVFAAPPGGFGAPLKSFGAYRFDIAYGLAPLPPRRPANIQIASLEPAAVNLYTRLIPGAQPIMENTQFEPRAFASR
jgi:hypothetical protein